MKILKQCSTELVALVNAEAVYILARETELGTSKSPISVFLMGLHQEAAYSVYAVYADQQTMDQVDDKLDSKCALCLYMLIRPEESD